MMRWFVTLGLVAVLQTSTWAQPCGPCGPCPPSGPGGVTTPGPMMNTGRDSDGPDDPVGRDRGPKDWTMADAIRHIGDNKNGAMRDPEIKEWLREQSPEVRQQFQDWTNNDYEFSGDPSLTRVPGTATPDYVCHDFAWRGGDTSKPESHLDPGPVLRDPGAYGYTEVSEADIKPGDIVVYHKQDPNQAVHSGLVTNTQGGVRLRSKDGSNSLFDHNLRNGDGDPNFFLDRHSMPPVPGQMILPQIWSGGGIRVFRPGPGANCPTSATPAAGPTTTPAPPPPPPPAP